MSNPQMVGALAALIFAAAALIRTLSGAFETRFSELRKELASVRAENANIRSELDEERRLRAAAELRAENAERHVAELVDDIITARQQMELMRVALIGSEAEKNEALRELARKSDNDARERARGAADQTGPHQVVK